MKYIGRPILIQLGLSKKLDRITIDISHINYEKIAYKREAALSKSILFSSKEDYVPAKMTYKGHTHRVKMRLKGDDTDHYIDKHLWSFRVKVMDGETIFGLRRFSLQHPKTRHYISEWIFHKYLEFNNLISLKYTFVEIILNGKNFGIYALEESFDKILIERNGYREGPILRFNEDIFWKKFAAEGRDEVDYHETYWGIDIDAFNDIKIAENPKLKAQFLKAKDMLEGYRIGKLDAAKVFNLDQLSMFFAVLDMWGHPHAHLYTNIRFYYNPITSLLEPIGYDAQLYEKSNVLYGSTKKSNISKYKKTWEALLFEHKEFFSKYLHALEKISAKDHLALFIKSVKDEFNLTSALLELSFPDFNNIDFAPFIHNSKFIRNTIKPEQSLLAYFQHYNNDKRQIELKIGNTSFMPIEILSLSYKKMPLGKVNQNSIISGKSEGKSVDYASILFSFLKPIEDINDLLKGIFISYRLLGTNEIKLQKVYPWPYFDADSIKHDDLLKSTNITKNDFLMVNERLKIIHIRRGRIQINEPLVIPKGYTFMAHPGTLINLTQGGKIISYSPLSWIGKEDNPIVVSSKDKTGQGIAVINARNTSNLEHVIFNNLSAPVLDLSWNLLGAVNFYQSSVIIKKCLFKDNHSSDDALNIIRSNFEINQSAFLNTFSDALDIDASTGVVNNSTFTQCGIGNTGGDGIDLSQSNVNVLNILINKVGDKGISVGEGSILKGQKIRISNAAMGIVSKDLSSVILLDSKIADSKIGLALYQKKSEWGPAKMQIKNVMFSNVNQPTSVEERSQLIELKYK